MCSFKQENEFNLRPVYAIPRKIYIQNYIDAWTVGHINIYFKNSLIATLSALLVIITFSSSAAFAIQIMKWRLSKAALLLFLTGIMIPVQVLLIPLFIAYKRVGLINNLLSLIISYSALGLPLSIYLFVSYFRYIPREILESAIMDGCNVYSLFARMIVPISRNVFLTVLTLQFFMYWNDLVFSMTFISKMNLKTIQTGLLSFVGEYGVVSWGPTFAAICVSVLPTIILYLILNKMVMQGMTAGAVKT
jgi:raffinose/stachyose/melibiose transport system permease protein